MTGLPPLPRDRVITEPEELLPFSRDEAARGASPRAVVFPVSTGEVSTLLRWASEERVAVVPRGAGSGLSGGVVPDRDSVVLALTRMTALSLDVRGRTAEAEPGVITGEIRKAAESEGLLYAPIPASVDFCTIGGNVATNAGGLCAVKYGTTREHVLALEAVLPSGEVIRAGGRYGKSSTGYNLVQLLCGSEGTLAVITRIVLRLLPLPRERVTLLVPFPSPAAASRAVLEVLSGGTVPPTLELLPRAVVEMVRARHPELTFPFPEASASLLIELDGDDAGLLAGGAERISAACARAGSGEAVVASGRTQREALWALRKLVRDSIANSGDFVEADSVVPRERTPELLAAAEHAASAAGLSQVSYGHAGDGNLHTYFRREGLPDKEWQERSGRAMQGFYEETARLGGTISGEHGIGILKKGYLPLVASQEEIALMKRIKAAFDPKGILNPGKVLP